MSYCPHDDFGIVSQLVKRAEEKGWDICPGYPDRCMDCLIVDDEVE